MADMILPSKLVPEQITVTFEFLDELDWGDTIVNAEVICTVAIGVDPNPEFVLRQDIGIFDTYVTQKVRDGLPGVFYRLVCLATTANGKVLEKKSVLAVLPAVAATPDLFGVAYTSWPYPIDFTENITSGATWHAGILEQIVVYDFIESVQSSAVWFSGEIAVAPEIFVHGDDMQSSAVWRTGIEETSIPYTVSGDDMQSSCEWRTGVEENAVGYALTNEDITSSCVWLAGSSP